MVVVKMLDQFCNETNIRCYVSRLLVLVLTMRATVQQNQVTDERILSDLFRDSRVQASLF